jgi:hypothetical protein
MDQLTITFITATSALISGIAGPLVSINAARWQVKATVISNNRERWIEALRDAVAEYIALVASVAMIERGRTNGDIGEIMRADEDSRRTGERMILVKSRIQLMTNPNDSSHGELCQSIEAVHAALMANEPLSLQQWSIQLETITRAGRAVLKAEWVRVKRGD